MKSMQIFLILLAMSIPSSIVAGTTTDDQVPEVLKYREGQKPVPARIAQFAWLVGNWRWEGNVYGQRQGTVHIFPAKDGQMMALARGYTDDNFWMSEVISYTQLDNTVEMRLRHFGYELDTWEPQKEPRIVRLLGMDGNVFYFDHHTVVKHNNNHYTLHLGLYNEDGSYFVVPVNHYRLE